MNIDIKNLTPQERYQLIGKLIEEIKLRKYSYQTGKLHIAITKEIIKSVKTKHLLEFSSLDADCFILSSLIFT